MKTKNLSYAGCLFLVLSLFIAVGVGATGGKADLLKSESTSQVLRRLTGDFENHAEIAMMQSYLFIGYPDARQYFNGRAQAFMQAADRLSLEADRLDGVLVPIADGYAELQ